MVAGRRPRRWFLPGSFRTRLTLSYTVITAALLAVALCGLFALALQISVRQTIFAVDAAAAATRRIVQEHWAESDARIAQYVVGQGTRAGVRIGVRAKRPPGIPQPSGYAGVGPLLAHEGVQKQGLPPPPRTLNSFFGLQTHVIWTHQGDVFVGPSLPIEAMLQIYLAAFAVAVAISTGVSWAIGRWVTTQALAPLTTVTKELRRFAKGNFEPRTLEANDHGELGELTEAYNGAAAQVAAAFSERERIEQHLRLFLGEAGHEMRTPLTVISAYLEMLEGSGWTESRLPDSMLATARSEARRLRNLIERVMKLARMEGADRSSAALVDVGEVALEAIAHVKSTRTGDIRLSDTSGDVVVLAERWELEEALGNLIDNAVTYGGNSTVRVSIESTARSVTVRVADRGPGISLRDRARLFQHFFRGDQAVGTAGTGLGLAIVARAATRLGGEIVLEHAGPPRGTTFRLTIPTYQPEPAKRQVIQIG
jgi:signal transduction histidine kinase